MNDKHLEFIIKQVKEAAKDYIDTLDVFETKTLQGKSWQVVRTNLEAPKYSHNEDVIKESIRIAYRENQDRFSFESTGSVHFMAHIQGGRKNCFLMLIAEYLTFEWNSVMENFYLVDKGEFHFRDS